MLRPAAVALTLAALLVTGGASLQRVHAAERSVAGPAAPVPPPAAVGDLAVPAAPGPPPTPAATPTPAPAPTAVPAPTPVPRPGFGAREASVLGLLARSALSGSVSLVELGGSRPATWSLNGDQSNIAASTYKLPLLMEEAQAEAAGAIHASDSICYTDADWEDGWWSDYYDGACFSRAELQRRVGHDSDNTAAHMLVRVGGGSDALNAYARSHGAHESGFFDPNATTSSDLAALWVGEARGGAGGGGAQQLLYQLLTGTSFELGIPAGVPAGTRVIHKIGELDSQVNDAAYIPAGPHGAYVLTIMTTGQSGDAAWHLIAQITQATWQYEAARP